MGDDKGCKSMEKPPATFNHGHDFLSPKEFQVNLGVHWGAKRGKAESSRM